MIKVENIEVFNFEGAIRGMRNPLESHAKSDSEWVKVDEGLENEWKYVIGKNDLELMHKLYKAGTEHRKYLRQIMVSMDITAPLYFYKEADTYKVGTTSNSCSTMHTIHKKEFELDDFSHEHLTVHAEECLLSTIKVLNEYREAYIALKDKKMWWQMIQLLPSSYNQRRTITMNYENVVNIIHQRSTHKLDEWQQFCGELSKLPYVLEIIGGM